MGHEPQTDKLMLAPVSGAMVGMEIASRTQAKRNLLPDAYERTGGDREARPPLVRSTPDTAGSRRSMIAAAKTDHGDVRTGLCLRYGRACKW